MNVFKLFIPKQNIQTVEELESYTVKWEVRDNGYERFETYHKVFIHAHDAHEFKKQLEASAKFIGAWIRTELNKN